MLKNHKRKRLALLLLLISISVIVIVFLLSGSKFYNSSNVVALVNDERIYRSDIEDELLEIFPTSDPKVFEIDRLPRNVLEFIAKEVFIKRSLYKNAKRAMIDKDRDVRGKIDRYSKKIIREHFIDYTVGKKITPRAARARYIELSDEVRDGREVKISHILVKTKYQAGKVVEKIRKNRSFASMVHKYSLDKRTSSTRGDLGYFKDSNIQKEFVETVSIMKKGDVSDPVKSDAGWHILKVTDIKVLKLEDFDKIENKIFEELKMIEIDKVFNKIIAEADVRILIDSL
jgi:parvulin-like peptidyl-prolyl isomerase